MLLAHQNASNNFRRMLFSEDQKAVSRLLMPPPASSAPSAAPSSRGKPAKRTAADIEAGSMVATLTAMGATRHVRFPACFCNTSSSLLTYRLRLQALLAMDSQAEASRLGQTPELASRPSLSQSVSTQSLWKIQCDGLEGCASRFR
jgi:hypothetical protein